MHLGSLDNAQRDAMLAKFKKVPPLLALAAFFLSPFSSLVPIESAAYAQSARDG